MSSGQDGRAKSVKGARAGPRQSMSRAESRQDGSADQSSVDGALAKVSRQVLGIKGVAGTAQGLRGGRPCVKVYIEADDARLRARLPKSVGGVPVDVEVTGPVVRW